MSWVSKGERRYFYRRERIDGRWRTAYVGQGATAVLASQIDKGRLKRKAEDERQRREEGERYAAVATLIDRLGSFARLVTSGTLLAAGFYRHDRGKWRKRRQR